MYKQIFKFTNILQSLLSLNVAPKFVRFEGTSSSIIKKRIEFYTKAKNDWWNTEGQYKALHTLNPLRVEFICTQLKKIEMAVDGSSPLKNLKILDVGCGGGIFSESLALLGADVTGIDPADELIEVAKNHSISESLRGSKLTYMISTVEDHALTLSDRYDVVTVFFIIEHVLNQKTFVKNCLKVLKPGGSLFILHCNRTWHMYLWYLWMMHIRRYLPTGLFTTDSYKKFLKPSELSDILLNEASGKFKAMEIRGMTVKWLESDARWTTSDKYWNVVHGIKQCRS
ncbi:Hexaprenyldihydroxybenzoate methyltransferase, mitochondrial [Chamberlinius hualienensis]